MARVRETRAMIAGMTPELQPGRYVFATMDAAPPDAIATIREPEGLSVIVPAPEGARGAPGGSPVMRMITLKVHSALDGVGLTAAVAGALAEAGIACNVVAGHHHDHIFLPEADAARALERLEALAREARG